MKRLKPIVTTIIVITVKIIMIVKNTKIFKKMFLTHTNIFN